MTETFSVVVDKNVPMATRDGTILRSDVYRPVAEGRYPVLLGRTQYNKESWGAWIAPTHTAAAGYVVPIRPASTSGRRAHANCWRYHPVNGVTATPCPDEWIIQPPPR